MTMKKFKLLSEGGWRLLDKINNVLISKVVIWGVETKKTPSYTPV